MKPHWSENAGWQFIGVVLSALGILISLLPENQRLLGFIVSMVGIVVLSWVLLRKPVKRITQQFTLKHVPRTSRTSIALASQLDVKKHSTIAKEDSGDTIKEKNLTKIQFALILLLTIALIALAFWEVSLIQNHMDTIYPLVFFIPSNTPPQSIKLIRVYDELYLYFEQILWVTWIGLSLLNLCIAYCVIGMMNSLLRKLRQLTS